MRALPHHQSPPVGLPLEPEPVPRPHHSVANGPTERLSQTQCTKRCMSADSLRTIRTGLSCVGTCVTPVACASAELSALAGKLSTVLLTV